MTLYEIVRIAIYIFIGIFLIFLIKRKVRRNGEVGSYNGVLFGFLSYYSIVPILILLNHTRFSQSGTNKYARTVATAEIEWFLLSIACIMLFVFFFSDAYNKTNNKLKTEVFHFDDRKLLSICKVFSLITFVIGGITFIIYIRAFGGISSMLARADYLRSFATSGANVVSYLASILVIPARLITVTPIVTSVVLSSNTRNKIVYWLIFIVSLFLAILFNLANAGRTGIIVFALCFIFPILMNRFRKPWIFTIVIGILFIPILSYLDALFVFFANGSFVVTNQDLVSYIPQFAHPSSNVLNAQLIVNENGLRFGQDYITGILNIIPGVNFTPSYVATSQFYGGSTWTITGGTPNDILTFGFLEFHVLGVVLNGVLLGLICGKIDRILRQIQGNYGINVIKTTLILSFFVLVFNADMVSIVRNQFTLTITSACVLYATRRVRGQ